MELGKYKHIQLYNAEGTLISMVNKDDAEYLVSKERAFIKYENAIQLNRKDDKGNIQYYR